MQKGIEWRCIVVDDSSTDNSVAVAQSFAIADSRFQVLSHSKRLGPSAARNTGARHVISPFMCFLDDDDLLLDSSLSDRAKPLQRATDDIAGTFCDWINVNADDGLEVFRPHRRAVRRGVVDFFSLNSGVPFICSSPMIRRSVFRQVGGFDEQRNRAEDADLWFRIARLGYCFVDVNNVGIAYRNSPGSLVTGAPLKQFLAIRDVLDAADTPDATLGDAVPLGSSASLSQVSIQVAQAAQTFRYLALITLTETPELALELGRATMGPIARRVALRDLNLVQIAFSAIGRLGLNTGEAKEAEATIASMFDQLQPTAEPTLDAPTKSTPSIYGDRFTEVVVPSIIPAHEFSFTNTVVLIAEAFYHVDEMGDLGDALIKNGQAVCFMMSPKTIETTLNAMGKYSHPIVEFSTSAATDAAAIVVLNDWGPIRDLIGEARSNHIPTFAKVEGVQDFTDVESTWARDPYRQAEYVLAQGQNDVDALPGATTFIVGSSRLERIWAEPTIERGSHALINLNFTFQVLTERRDDWIHGVADALNQTEHPGVVSRHPAERGDTAGIPVTNDPFRHAITSAGILISRFSTVPFEAMARGVPFIYHNPHGERMPAFHGLPAQFWTTDSIESLTTAITSAFDFADDYRQHSAPFFEQQVSIEDQPSAERAASAIISVLEKAVR